MGYEPLQQLGYFTEWGGRSWESLVRTAMQYLAADGRLDGLDLLEIGTRYGKMAQLFAAQGANVTAIDISDKALARAREDADSWFAQHGADLRQPPGRLDFLVYGGSLDLFADESFDVVFTKSVLVVVPELEPFLAQIARKLRPGGRVVLIENAKGPSLLHLLRALRHRHWDFRRAHYFTRREVKLVQSLFEIETARETMLPPIYLFLGKRRP